MIYRVKVRWLDLNRRKGKSVIYVEADNDLEAECLAFQYWQKKDWRECRNVGVELVQVVNRKPVGGKKDVSEG